MAPITTDEPNPQRFLTKVLFRVNYYLFRFNAFTGTLMANPAQAETAAFIRRASIRKKPTSNYRVTSPKPTNNNKPASVTNSVSERTNNNNQSTSNRNSSTIRKSIRKMQKIQN
ncbi:MAG: hypothetical protein SWZ49_29670 [Cyanobacteriota bacterium]|nr:hypothetical protein [Cyanobacteriota bacterium]